MDTPTLAILFIIGIISFILIITIVVVLVMVNRKDPPPNNPTFYIEPQPQPEPEPVPIKEPAPPTIEPPAPAPAPVVFQKSEPLYGLFSDPSDDEHHTLLILSDDSDDDAEDNKSTVKIGQVDEVIKLSVEQNILGMAKYGRHDLYLINTKSVLINGGDFDREVVISQRCIDIFTFSGQVNFLSEDGKIYTLDNNDFKSNNWNLTPAYWSLISNISCVSTTFDQKYLWVCGSGGSGLYTAGDSNPTLTQSTERFIKRSYGKSMYDYIEFVDNNGIIHPQQELYPNIHKNAVLNYHNEVVVPENSEKLFKLGWNVASQLV